MKIRVCLFNLLLQHGWSIGALVEALLRLVVAVLVKPDVLRGQALKSTHGAVKKDIGRLRPQKQHFAYLNALRATVRHVVTAANPQRHTA